MTELSHIFPPPDAVRRQAWQAAFVLLRVYRDKMTSTEAQNAMDLVQAGAAGLGWTDISAVQALGRRVAERKSTIRRS